MNQDKNEKKYENHPEYVESSDEYATRVTNALLNKPTESDGKPVKTVRNARRGVKALLPIAIVLSLVMSATSLTMIYGVSTQTYNVGSNFVSVTSAFGFNTNGTMSLAPGDTVPLIITVNNGHHSPSLIALSYNASNPQSFTAVAAASQGQVIQSGLYTVNYQSGTIAPTNICTSNPTACEFYNTPRGFATTVPSGISTIALSFIVSNTANADSFTMQWTAVPQ